MDKPISLLLTKLDLRPFNEYSDFENFVTDYFNDLEDCHSYRRFGVQGQKQHGLDVYSYEKKTVIQCKVRNMNNGFSNKYIKKNLINELNTDFNSFVKYNNENELEYDKFIFASTFGSDTEISTECSKLSNDKISVEYWSWDDLKRQMPDKTFEAYYNELIPYLTKDQQLRNFSKKIEYKFNKKDNIIEQLYNYFQYLFSQIKIIPIQILKNNYPFKNSENFYPYYSNLTLITDNDQLYGLFDSIEIEENRLSIKNISHFDDVENVTDKLKYILKKLSAHLVFNIKDYKTNNVKNIRFSPEEFCECERCSFKRLEYLKTFNVLAEKPNDVEDSSLKAYMHYELGNFIESALLFEEVAKNAKKKNENIRFAIARFNLSKLYVFVRNHYWGENENPKLLERLKSLNIDVFSKEHTKYDNQEIINWIFSNEFFTTKLESINRNVNKIRDHYDLQQKGGWSYNNNILSLISDYAEIKSFLEENYIVYDKFAEFSELTDIFIEGLFMSHSMNEDQDSKLQYFDDWLFSQMIFNGNADKMLKLFKRYEIKYLKYKSTSQKGETFIDLAKNHLTKHENIPKAYEKSCDQSNSFFWRIYNNMFNNLVLLLSISDIQNNDIKLISRDVFKYLDKSGLVNRNSSKYTQMFINYKGKFIDNSVLYNFLDSFIVNGKFHEYIFIESIIEQIKANDDRLIIERSKLDKLFSITFGECEVCKRYHSSEIITLIYDAVSENLKPLIKSRIIRELDNKFDSDLYYMSVIYDVFDCFDDYFESFVEYSKPKSDNVISPNISKSAYKKDLPEVNMLLNICFKNNIDLKQPLFDDFKDINDYYSWLFNLDGFDYDKFDPKWTSEYNTKYYYNEFKKHPIIKQKIIEYLKYNNDYKVQKVLLSIIT